MTDEQLKIADDIKKRIDKLDDEIYKIMDITPAIREAEGFQGDRRGWIQKIVGKKLIVRPGLNDSCQIELSNEDCRALVDIRTAELQALKQVLENI